MSFRRDSYYRPKADACKPGENDYCVMAKFGGRETPSALYRSRSLSGYCRGSWGAMCARYMRNGRSPALEMKSTPYRP